MVLSFNAAAQKLKLENKTYKKGRRQFL